MEISRLKEIQRKHENSLISKIPGVWAVGVGENTIKIYIHPDSQYKHLIPHTIEAVLVEVIEGPLPHADNDEKTTEAENHS